MSPSDFLKQLIDFIIATGLPQGELWFRGQADASWPLVPRLLRSPNYPLGESGMLQRYRNRAIGMLENEPSDGDPARWLFIMQHHGLPTRLLDWTESALAAAFFAIDGSPHADGRLFIIAPISFNESQIGRSVICHPQTSPCNEIFMASFKGTDKPKNIVASVAYGSEDRVARQRSCFTVHGIADDLQIVAPSKALSSLTIPSALKPTLKATLTHLGITRTSLFHDLDSLAREVREQYGFF